MPEPQEAIGVEELVEELGAAGAETYAEMERDIVRAVAAKVAIDLDFQQRIEADGASFNLTIQQQLARARARQEIQATIERASRAAAGGMSPSRLVTEAGRAGIADARAVTRGGAANLRAAVTPVAETLASSLDGARVRAEQAGRSLFDRIVSSASSMQVGGQITGRQAADVVAQKLLEQGVTGLTDRSSRRWTLTTYAEMATRTAANRAYNDAAMAQVTEFGSSLVQVQGGIDACKFCAPWIGKVLSTDGSMNGTVQLPSSLDGRSVEVEIAGSVDDARRAGWNHPNCRDRLSPFLPGIPAAQEDFEYNAAAEAERAMQRTLERRIRKARLQEAAAVTPEQASQAAARVRERQAEMQQFIAETGRKRKPYRERLSFTQ